MRIVRRNELIHSDQYLALTFVLVSVHFHSLFGTWSQAFFPSVLSCLFQTTEPMAYQCSFSSLKEVWIFKQSQSFVFVQCHYLEDSFTTIITFNLDTYLGGQDSKLSEFLSPVHPALSPGL